MITITDFKNSLENEFPESHLSPLLKSLWHDGKGNWEEAHAQVEKLRDKDAAWVHAYLHRKEGDLWNADYWYDRAGKHRPMVALEEEWDDLVRVFVGE